MDSASDRLRETTGAFKGEGPWHSANSAVYHNNHNWRAGNSIKTENVRQGTGGKPLCEECERLDSAGGPIGTLPASDRNLLQQQIRTASFRTKAVKEGRDITPPPSFITYSPECVEEEI